MFRFSFVAGGSPLLPGTRSVRSSFVACQKCHRDLQATDGVPTGKNAYDTKTEHKCYIRALRPSYGKTKERYVDQRGEFYFFDMETCIVTKENGKKIF